MDARRCDTTSTMPLRWLSVRTSDNIRAGTRRQWTLVSRGYNNPLSADRKRPPLRAPVKSRHAPLRLCLLYSRSALTSCRPSCAGGAVPPWAASPHDHLMLELVTLIGLSMGGRDSMMVTATYPGKVETIGPLPVVSSGSCGRGMPGHGHPTDKG
jgi:hypothetical protein